MECIVFALFIAIGLAVPSMKQAPKSQDVKEGQPPGSMLLYLPITFDTFPNYIAVNSSTEHAPRIAPGNDVELGTLPSRS
jgi:hypothetical protein